MTIDLIEKETILAKIVVDEEECLSIYLDKYGLVADKMVLDVEDYSREDFRGLVEVELYDMMVEYLDVVGYSEMKFLNKHTRSSNHDNDKLLYQDVVRINKKYLQTILDISSI